MGSVTVLLRRLRADATSWQRYDRVGTSASAVVAVGATFGLFAFNRFGFGGLISPRPSVRMVLVGVYGWASLTVVTWLLARSILHVEANLAVVLRLFGYAHAPLLAAAIAIQIAAVTFRALGPGMVAMVFGLGVWMPAMLVAAARQSFALSTARAVRLTALPYLAWIATVGRWLVSQIGHLL